MSQATSTVREVVFDLLRSFGMTTIFGNPGSTELPMLRDFPDDFTYILGLQESVVAGMADGFAQASRNAALVNLHSAAGVGHALGNIFTASKNQTPLVVVAGQQARSMLPFDPFLGASDAATFPRPHVKWSCEPARAEDVPQAIAQAYYIAMQAPCGPTFVSVPADDWDRPCAPLQRRAVASRVAGDGPMLDQIADALDAAVRPAFVVGAGVALDDAWHEIVALAELHNAAVWVSPMSGRNAFPESHPLFMGFLPADRPRIADALREHDVVLVAGAPVFTYHVEGEGVHVQAGTKLFQLVADPQIAAAAATGTSVVTSLQPGLAHLFDRCAPPSRQAPAPRTVPSFGPGAPLDAGYVLARLGARRRPGTVIVEEAPSARIVMQAVLPMDEPDSFYTCASGGLGHGLPAALGVALASPNRKVVAILGDGSAMYAAQALWTAATYRLPILFIILNNRRYEALIAFGQRMGIDEVVGTSLAGIDFVQLAEAQGCGARPVSDADELERALDEGLSASEPLLLDIRVA